MAQIFKPDQLLGDQLSFSSPEELYTHTKNKIKSNSQVPEAFKILMTFLLDYCHKGALYPNKTVWEAAEKTKQNKSTGVTIAALETDFAEILGPLMLAAKSPQKYGKIRNKKWLVYPSAGNEGMYDYLLNGIKYSAKAGSSKASNVVGLGELVSSPGFDDLPDTLEKRMCLEVSKSPSTVYQPIDAIMFLISEGVSLPTINSKKFKAGYKPRLGPNSVISKEWIEVAAKDNVVGEYFDDGKFKPKILAVGKITSVSSTTLTLDKITKPSGPKYANVVEVSSKNDYTNLYIRVLGTSAEGEQITAYNAGQKKITLRGANKYLTKGSKIEIYAKNNEAITAKLISGICADELAEMCQGTNSVLDFTDVMSIFAPIFVKVKLGSTSAEVAVDPKSKKVIRNKNHPTNPRGIVRGKLGIQP
jgi:hypothetical protein